MSREGGSESHNDKKALKYTQFDVSPPPWPAMLHIAVIHVGQALQTTMLLPILVFMVRSYGVAGGRDHDIGKYTGVLAALFPLGQFCTSMLWGLISDRTGRKVWLLFGTVVTGVSAMLLGLCRSYECACAVRLANGLLNCTLLITKSVLSELCDKTNINAAFGVLNLMWGVGAILGSVLGGMLADPCQLYHLERCPRLLQAHPFILPFLVMCLVSVLGAISSLHLPETLRRSGAYKGLPTEEELELGRLERPWARPTRG